MKKHSTIFFLAILIITIALSVFALSACNPKLCDECGYYPSTCPVVTIPCEDCGEYPCDCQVIPSPSPCEDCGEFPCDCQAILSPCDECEEYPCDCPSITIPCEDCDKHPCDCPSTPTQCDDCLEYDCICPSSKYLILPFVFTLSSSHDGWFVDWGWQELGFTSPFTFRVYHDRHCGQGFKFVGNTIRWAEFRISNFNLSEGKHSVRIVSIDPVKLSYNDFYATIKGYWEFEHKRQNHITDYEFSFDLSNSRILWDSAGWQYAIYMQTNTGFEFIENVFTGSGARFNAVQPQVGTNIMRVVSTQNNYTYQNGTLYFGISTGYFEFEKTYEDYEADYTFTLSNNNNFMFWRGDVWGGSYNVFIDRHDGQGFWWLFQRNALTNIALDTLSLIDGYYTLKVVSTGAKYREINGILTLGISTGFWEFDFVQGDAYHPDEIYIEGGNTIWGRLRQYVGYRVYINRHDGEGFVFERNIARNMGVGVGAFNPSEGKNTVRFVSGTVWQYDDGVLSLVSSYGYWEFEYVLLEAIEADEIFTITTEGQLIWGGGVPWSGIWINRAYIGCHEYGFELLFDGRSWIILDQLDLSENRDYVIKFYSGRFWNYEDGVIKRHIYYQYFEFEFKNQDFVNEEAEFSLLDNNRIYWGTRARFVYRVYIDRRDGEGFEFVGEFGYVGWTTPIVSIPLSNFNLVGGEYIIRVSTINDLWRFENGVIYKGARIAYWSFEVEKNYTVFDRTFGVNFRGDEIDWWDWDDRNRQEAVYIDRHDDKGFVFVQDTWTQQRIAVNLLNPSLGQNTMMVRCANPSATYISGIISFLEIRFLWEFEFTQNDFYTNYTFNAWHDRLSFNNNFNADYIIYVDRHDNLGFVLVHSIMPLNITLTSLGLTLGHNTVRVVSSPIFSYQNGVFNSGLSTGYWQVELVYENFSASHSFSVFSNRFTIFGPSFGAPSMRIYIDRDDGLGFVFFSNSDANNRLSFIIEDANFSAGKNIIRSTANNKAFNFVGDGILKWGYNIYYFEFEFVVENSITADYVFGFNHSISVNTPSGWINGGLSFEGARITYEIYVDRHDGLGFVHAMRFADPSTYFQAFAIHPLGLAQGKNTLRLRGLEVLSFEHDIMRVRTRTAYFELEYREQNHIMDYEFERDFSGFRWTRRNERYRVYINRHDGNGFVFMSTTEAVMPGFNLLNPVIGQNTIRVVSAQNIFNFKEYNVLYFGQSRGYWEFEFKQDYIMSEYQFEMWVISGSNQLRWHGRTFGQYRVYIDRDDGNGFGIITSAANNSSVLLSMLNPSIGTNTIRVISANNTIIYYDGVVTQGQSIAYFKFVFSRDDRIFEQELFLGHNGISLGGNGRSVYMDRHDGQGFEFVLIASGSWVQLDSLELVGGEYTLRVVVPNRTWSLFEGGMFYSFIIIYFNFEFELEAIVLDYDFEVVDRGELVYQYWGIGMKLLVLMFNPSQYRYYVYFDAHDGQGFISFDWIYYDEILTGVIWLDYFITEGMNTMKFVSRGTEIVDGVIKMFTRTATWKVYFENIVNVTDTVLSIVGSNLVLGEEGQDDGIYIVFIDDEMHNIVAVFPATILNLSGANFLGELEIRIERAVSFEYDNGVLTITRIKGVFILYRHPDGVIEILKTTSFQ